LQLGLVEASRGRLGSLADHLLLLCYGYDPTTGKYGLLIMSFVRTASVAMVLAIAGFIAAAIYRERTLARRGVVRMRFNDQSTAAEP
jgi:protein SCO1/2